MKFQHLIHELDLSTRMIAALLDGITSEEARIKPDAESWSILEVTCHLLDEEREDFREHLDFILHHQEDGSWHPIDPGRWVTERKYNQNELELVRKEFMTERRRSLEWLQGIAASDWDTSYTTEFRTMSAGDMLSSWVAHDNLHIRQLVELRRLRIERITHPYQIEYAGDW